jgi:signal transduction histidine kinase
LDLRLPDAEGDETLARVRAAAPNVPIVVLTGFDDDGLALRAIQQGAQDYLAKDAMDGRLLVRTIRHAIERNRCELQLLGHARAVEAAHAQIEQQAVQLHARATQLDRINHELDEFAYIASHDLKEPLRGIRGYCELLLEDYHAKLDAAGQRRLAKLVDLCNRLENLIGDLLTYCRVGGVRPAETGIPLDAVVAELLDTLGPAIERRKAVVHLSGPLPAVTGDGVLIATVLGNLISNGLKFNDQPEPRVEIGALPTEPPTIYVRDNGIGIAPEHHEAIFTLFRRLHPRSRYEGTGAGLTIVRKIVQAHGGRIWLESSPGAGTTFYFTLAPAAAQQSVEEKPRDEAQSAAVQRPPAEPTPRPPHWVEMSHAETPAAAASSTM